jgi:hypothetical protein
MNVVLVLQSCTGSQNILPGSSNETFPTSSDSTYDVGNITVYEDVDVIEESFIAVGKEADSSIKQEEIPEDEVSYVSICLLLDTFDTWDFQAKHKIDAKFVRHNETSRATYRIL